MQPRTMIGGGDSREVDYDIYSPYYTQLLPGNKPTLLNWGAAPPSLNLIYNAYELNYGSDYTLFCTIGLAGVSLKKAVLIAPGSTTHHSDMHQRYLDLDGTITGTSQVTFTIPANENLAPRGLYMLWLVTTTQGVSDAMWVVLR